MLKDQGEKISSSDRGDIESAISALREALKGDDATAIRRAMNNLERSSHKVAEEMYKSAGGARGAAAPPPPGQEQPKAGPSKGGDDVIDAEYEVKE